MSVYHECQYQETPESSACGFYAEAGIHRGAEECGERLGRPCPKPEVHHVFVPRADVSRDLSDADVRTVINALEAALALPEAMRKPYDLADKQRLYASVEWREQGAQALHDRLLAYMDLVAAGEAFSPYDDSDAHAAVRAIEVAKEALRAALAELEALP